MKKLFMAVALTLLVGCEDQNEVIHNFYRPYTFSKTYPVYLDASDILVDIQVTLPVPIHEAFKIVSNDAFFFVGEKMRGIHVFEKVDEGHANPLCFIECKHLKAFDVAGDLLYANNFADLLAIDVKNPQQAAIVHREHDYFNHYVNVYTNVDYNIPKVNIDNQVDAYLIGYNHLIFTGTETDVNPMPDFSAYDNLYNMAVVKEIPDTIPWEKPYVGFANVEGEMFTLGDRFLAQCAITSYGLQVNQIAIDIPNFTSFVPIDNLQYKNNTICVSWRYGLLYSDMDTFTQNKSFQLLGMGQASDVTPVAEPANSFVFLYFYDMIWVLAETDTYTYFYTPSNGATSLMSKNDTLIALGDKLSLYRFRSQSSSPIEEITSYSSISGDAMLREGNTLIVANRRGGLSFYDISKLNNITPLQ